MRHFRRHDGRVYTIFSPAQDLFGTWVVLTVHGTLRSRQGGLKTYPAADLVAATKLETTIAKTRIRHGYIEQGLSGMMPQGELSRSILEWESAGRLEACAYFASS